MYTCGEHGVERQAAPSPPRNICCTRSAVIVNLANHCIGVSGGAWIVLSWSCDAWIVLPQLKMPKPQPLRSTRVERWLFVMPVGQAMHMSNPHQTHATTHSKGTSPRKKYHKKGRRAPSVGCSACIMQAVLVQHPSCCSCKRVRVIRAACTDGPPCRGSGSGFQSHLPVRRARWSLLAKPVACPAASRHQPSISTSPLTSPSPAPVPQVLQSAFTALMTAEPGLVKSQCAALISRLQAKADSPDGGGGRTARDSLVLRLHSQYEGDVGVLSSYFLNMVGGCVWVTRHWRSGAVKG